MRKYWGMCCKRTNQTLDSDTQLDARVESKTADDLSVLSSHVAAVFLTCTKVTNMCS